MLTYETIKKLCKKKGVTVTGTEKVLGFAKGSLCKVNTSKPSMEKVQKLAKYFDVPIEYLMGEKEYTYETVKDSSLTSRDQRDIGKALDEIMAGIEGGEDGPIYYNGIEVNSESVGFLKKAIEFALTETKKENKVKYNPNKNKK